VIACLRQRGLYIIACPDQIVTNRQGQLSQSVTYHDAVLLHDNIDRPPMGILPLPERLMDQCLSSPPRPNRPRRLLDNISRPAVAPSNAVNQSHSSKTRPWPWPERVSQAPNPPISECLSAFECYPCAYNAGSSR